MLVCVNHVFAVCAVRIAQTAGLDRIFSHGTGILSIYTVKVATDVKLSPNTNYTTVVVVQSAYAGEWLKRVKLPPSQRNNWFKSSKPLRCHS